MRCARSNASLGSTSRTAARSLTPKGSPFTLMVRPASAGTLTVPRAAVGLTPRFTPRYSTATSLPRLPPSGNTSVKQGQIEIERVLLQRFEFDAKHLLVPSRAHGQAIVRENERAPLRFREVIQHDDRHLFHAQASSSRQAGVPSDHNAVGTEKYRVRPPEFDDAGGNLSHLFVRVRPGVPGVRDQLVDGPNLYGEVAEARRRCTHAGDFPIRRARFRRHAWAFLFGP